MTKLTLLEMDTLKGLNQITSRWTNAMRRELGGVAKVLFNEKTTSGRLHEASQLGLMKPHCATS